MNCLTSSRPDATREHRAGEPGQIPRQQTRHRELRRAGTDDPHLISKDLIPARHVDIPARPRLLHQPPPRAIRFSVTRALGSPPPPATASTTASTAPAIPSAAGAGRAAQGGCRQRGFRRSGASGTARPHGGASAPEIFWTAPNITPGFVAILTSRMPHVSAANCVRVTPVSDSGRRPVNRSRRNFSRSTPAMTLPASGLAVPSFQTALREEFSTACRLRICLPDDLIYNYACTRATLCSDVRGRVWVCRMCSGCFFADRVRVRTVPGRAGGTSAVVWFLCCPQEGGIALGKASGSAGRCGPIVGRDSRRSWVCHRRAVCAGCVAPARWGELAPLNGGLTG